MWLERLERSVTSEESREFRRWLKTRSHRVAVVDRCKRWHGPEILAVLGEIIPTEAFAEERAERRYDRMLIAIVFGVSALALTTVLIATTRGWSQSGPQHALARSESLFQTRTGERKRIKLPDGSAILMNEHARLYVSYISATREVSLLRGEATFEVREDPKRAFIVYAGARQFNVITGSATFDISRVSQEAWTLLVASGEVQMPVPRVSTRLSPALVREHVSSGSHTFVSPEIGTLGPDWFSAASVQAQVIDARLSWQRGLDMKCGMVDGAVGAYYVCSTAR
jgi:transmembrane sensor